MCIKSTNGRHANMLFTIQNEKQNRMSFLDVQVICEDKTVTTSVYRKLTFSGVYTHFGNFLLSTFVSLVLLTHSHVDDTEYAEVGLNYTMN